MKVIKSLHYVNFLVIFSVITMKVHLIKKQSIEDYALKNGTLRQFM